MTRIYFDSNVFSNLRKNVEPNYQQLNKYIKVYKPNLSFLFSHAHIRDKKNDKQDIKYDDFAYMESLVGDNYLSYDVTEKRSTFYLATPQAVFDNEEVNDDFEILLNFWKPDANEDNLLTRYKSFLRGLSSQIQVPNNSELNETLSAEHKSLINQFVPTNRTTGTLEDLMVKFTDFAYRMLTDNHTYRELRRILDKQFNDGKFVSKEGSLDFNEALKDSSIQMTFIEYVRNSFNKKDDETIDYYDLYTTSYIVLDMLGVSKDKLSPKNKFNNLFNDALHSYYAGYCDYYVSEDKSSKHKSKALYNLNGVETQVVSVEEFLVILPTIGKSSENHLLHFFEKLSVDIRESARTNEQKVANGTVYMMNIKKGNIYLNCFDEIIEFVNDEESYYFLQKRVRHALSTANYRETGMIVDKCIKVFGMDLNEIGKLNFDKEVEEIQNKKWVGRSWNACSLMLSLKIDETFKELGLWVGPLNLLN